MRRTPHHEAACCSLAGTRDAGGDLGGVHCRPAGSEVMPRSGGSQALLDATNGADFGSGLRVSKLMANHAGSPDWESRAAIRAFIQDSTSSSTKPMELGPILTGLGKSIPFAFRIRWTGCHPTRRATSSLRINFM